MATSPNQAHGNNSRPAAVTLKPGFKTNIEMTTTDRTPKQGGKLKPALYQTKAALNGNGLN